MQHPYDLELRTYFYDRKKEVKEQYIDYTKKHEEIRQILNDYTSELLFKKPKDVYKFTQEYFSFYNVQANDPFRHPLVLAGPKRAGRRTLALQLQSKYSNLFEMAVSHTTRP